MKTQVKRPKRYELIEEQSGGQTKVYARSSSKHFLETKKKLYKRVYDKNLIIITRVG